MIILCLLEDLLLMNPCDVDWLLLHIILVQFTILRLLFSVIDTAEGFLNEWWTLFYDVYSSRPQLKHQEANAEAPVQVIVCWIDLNSCFGCGDGASICSIFRLYKGGRMNNNVNIQEFLKIYQECLHLYQPSKRGLDECLGPGVLTYFISGWGYQVESLIPIYIHFMSIIWISQRHLQPIQGILN